MNRAWIAGAAVVGVGLAVLLVRLPGGGSEGIAAPEPVVIPTEGRPMTPVPADDGLARPQGGDPAPAEGTPAPTGRPGPIPANNRLGIAVPNHPANGKPNPHSERLQKLRDTPAGHASAKQQAPLQQLGMDLAKSNDPEVAALGKEMLAAVGDLRENLAFARIDEYPEIQAHVDDMVKRAKDKGLATGETGAMIERLEAHSAEYHKDSAAAAPAPATP